MKLTRTSYTTFTDVLSLADAKAHLRVEHSDDDTLIGTLIDTAGEIVEEYTGLWLGRSSYKLSADSFSSVMRVHVGPNPSVSSIAYIDDNNTTQQWSSSHWQTDLDSYPLRVWFEELPSNVDERPHAVQIYGQAGYSSDVPATLVSAMLLIIGHLYEHRKDVLVGVQSAPLVHGAKYLMDKFKPSTL